MVDSVFSVGQNVDVLYPKHGNRNILRRVAGCIIDAAIGPNGPYVTVESRSENNAVEYRSLSLKKIVRMK
jgi:hypothetical protein